MDQGEKITDDIIARIMKSVEDEYGCRIDQKAILRGIACAYIAFAYRLNAKDEAKELLLDLAEQLDDPATLHWVHFTAPVSRGLLLAHALAQAVQLEGPESPP
jgi:hypothetical protein